MSKITSELKFVFGFLLSLLKTPFILLMVLLGKRKPGELFYPFRQISEFIWQTKFTTWIILINIVLYVLVNSFNSLGIIDAAFIERFFLTRPSDLLTFNIISIIGSWFMHANALHLLGNMGFLFVLGRIVEKEFGLKKTMMIYFGSAIISTIINALYYLIIIGQDVSALGASGAIAGLASTAMLISPLSITFLVAGLPLPIFVVSWSFLLTDLAGVLNPMPGDNVGHVAHLGGFFAISLLLFLLDKKDKDKLLKGFLFNAATFLIFAAIKIYYGI